MLITDIEIIAIIEVDIKEERIDTTDMNTVIIQEEAEEVKEVAHNIQAAEVSVEKEIKTKEEGGEVILLHQVFQVKEMRAH
jgi:hypothetical protein